jgi:SAM-dependent methyltransferase
VSTTAAVHGPRWGARASDWAEVAAGLAQPAWQAVADATRIGRGARVLDIACGSGEFCRMAAARGAQASGIDAAAGMIDVARRLQPDGDFRLGPMEDLPWQDDRFDVVTAFNALQFAADPGTALAEATRVTRPGGQVGVCHWGRPEDCELFAIMGALRELQAPPPAGTSSPGPPGVREPGVLQRLIGRVGLVPVRAAEVDVPLEAADQATFERAMLASGGVAPAIEHSGEPAVRKRIVEAAAPFRRPDGSYRLENRFSYVIADLPGSGGS